jgi:hypothetical protein
MKYSAVKKVGEELAGILFANCTGWMDRRLNTYICCSFSLFILKNRMAKATILLCAQVEINANDPVRFQKDEHNKYLNATMAYHGKTNEDIKTLIGTSCNTNQLLAKNLGGSANWLLEPYF